MNLLYKLLLIVTIYHQFSSLLGNHVQKNCPQTRVHNVVWHESEPSENYIVSEPLCLDNLKMIVPRNCSAAGWLPPNNDIGCKSHQDEFKFDAYCPTGYTKIFNTRICILILNSQEWSTNCVHHGSIVDVPHLIRTEPKIVKFLRDQRIDKFWLPAKRDNNTEFLKWKLPPPLWNKVVEYDMKKAIPIDNNGDCLCMNVDLYQSLENCETKLPLVCLLDRKTETMAMKSFCPDRSVSARPQKYRSTCFIVKPFADLEDHGTLFLIDTMDSYFVVQSVIQEFDIENAPVLVDLLPGQGGVFNKFDWAKSIDDINFIDWNHRLDQKRLENIQIDLYTVVWNKKWDLVDGELLKYAILEDKYYLGDLPTITIHYNSTYDGLDVHINNMIGLWTTNNDVLTCYSNENILQPILKFDKVEDAGDKWKLTLPYFKGNARYWCESVTVSDFVAVKSNVVEVQRNIFNNDQIFSVLIELSCNVCQFYYELNQIQNFIKYLTKVVKETKDFGEVNWQIKQIVEFKRNTSTVTILFHCIVDNPHGYNKSKSSGIIHATVSQIINARVIFVRDISTCFSANPDFPDTLNGHQSVYRKPSTLENSSSPVQNCAGNLIEGAFWQNTSCIETSMTMLEWLKKSTIDVLFDTPTNVQYITEMLQSVIDSTDLIFDVEPNSTLHETPIDTMFEIIDTIINQEPLVLQKAQRESNTSNIMLEMIDETARKYSTSKSFAMDLDGTFLNIQRHLIVMITNPLVRNVTGIAIYKKPLKQTDDSFENYSIRKLFGNETYEDIYNETLETGVNIPFETLAQIVIMRDGVPLPVDRIIIKIFYKDSFFQEAQANGTTQFLKANSKVIGITIPEYHDGHLPSGIFMILKKNVHDMNSTEYGCSDWMMNSTKSGWNKNYAHFEILNKSRVLCQVTRLRNYGFVKLLGNGLVNIDPPADTNVESDVILIITIVGCILSLFGIFVIFTAAFVIKAWRNREATPLILNVCTATALQLICYLLSETQLFRRHAQCLIIGASLHYVTIVGFFLSLFVSNLQFRRYVIIIGPSIPTHFKMRLLICGWVVPLLIVCICMHINPGAYTPNETYLDLGGICYPSGAVLLFAVHTPVIVIFCVNLILYIWIIVNLNIEGKHLRKSPTKSNISKQIFLFAYAFFLMSLTWIFGILANFFSIPVFSYLFVITGTLQGFFMFLFCIIFDSSIRRIFRVLE